MNILSVSGLGKTYTSGPESLEILKDITLSVDDGSTVVVTGESGSGKSTLLNLIGGARSSVLRRYFRCGVPCESSS